MGEEALRVRVALLATRLPGEVDGVSFASPWSQPSGNDQDSGRADCTNVAITTSSTVLTIGHVNNIYSLYFVVVTINLRVNPDQSSSGTA